MTTIEFDNYALDERTCKRIIRNLSYLAYTIGYKRSGTSCMLTVTTKQKMNKKDLRDIFIMELLEFAAEPENAQ